MPRYPLHPITACLNKKQKNHAKQARSQALEWLAQRFPEAFETSQRIRPLKTGIMHDVLAITVEAEKAGISRTKLREAVVLFTRRLDYLTCLKAKEMRIDLDGQPTTFVTSEEAERAALKIKKRLEKRNAQKATTSTPSSATHKPRQSFSFPSDENPSVSRYASSAKPTSRPGPQIIIRRKPILTIPRPLNMNESPTTE
ncbi:MAG: ProQ/FinO family protein [Legionellaceae bacterium]|nr:ProQ/FinO family protein [Legionellaceae bacterium]